MITKNKLSGKSDTRSASRFAFKDASNKSDNKKTKKQHKRARFVLILLALLIIVAGATFGLIFVVRNKINTDEPGVEIPPIGENAGESGRSDENTDDKVIISDEDQSIQSITSSQSSNPTIKYGRLMLINPNFMVEDSFIASRKTELVSLTRMYGIAELHAYNGDNLIDSEAASQLSKMLADYSVAYPGHSIQTVSCFRPVGTNCGRLCMPTGASDHHTGLTCDLIDPVYGDSLDTSTYTDHIEWQWLKANSYKYGFIDRFPENWAGGSMSEPMNIDANGTTGLYETWHYRYVGLFAAKQIATGVYNNGDYDSLEHYLLARGLVTDLLKGF